MDRPANHPPEHFYEGRALRDLLVNVSRALDQSPQEVETLHGIVIGVMHEHFPPSDAAIPQHEFVARLYPLAVARMEKSDAGAAALEAIVDRYDRLPTTEIIRIAKNGENSIVKLILIGLVAGAVVSGVACIYLASKYPKQNPRQ